ncbi:MAG TPA: tetratricopeptide repeat protein [Terriglobales bacterium]|jgi:hypothetical protein|nr:tetratricopeptide repeat protein [Terriglobales bacterium]
MKALKILLVVIVVLVALAVISARLVPRLLEARLSEGNGDVKSAAFLTRIANKAKRDQGLPRMVDGDQEMLDIAGQEGMLVYSFRLVKVNATEFDAQKFLTRVKPIVAERACSQSENGLFILKQGIVMRYSYVDKFDVPVGSFDVNPDDCGAGHDSSPTDRVGGKPAGAQPEQQTDAKPDSPWRSETQTARHPSQNTETPEEKARALVADGNWQFEHKNNAAAIKDFKAALELDPNNYEARSGLQEAQTLH